MIIKNSYFLEKKVAKIATEPKSANISTSNAECESPKHLHQTTFETLKYHQQMVF
jgi:hypothetical protein